MVAQQWQAENDAYDVRRKNWDLWRIDRQPHSSGRLSRVGWEGFQGYSTQFWRKGSREQEADSKGALPTSPQIPLYHCNVTLVLMCLCFQRPVPAARPWSLESVLPTMKGPATLHQVMTIPRGTWHLEMALQNQSSLGSWAGKASSSPSQFPTPLLASPGNTFLISQWHPNPHLRVCYGVKLCPPKIYVKILIPGSWKCDLIWK